MKRLDVPSDKNIDTLLLITEKLATAKTVPQATFDRIQQAADTMDDALEAPDYRLYELQALLYYIAGDTINAYNYIEDALVLEAKSQLYTKTGQKIIKEYYNLENTPLDDLATETIEEQPSAEEQATASTKVYSGRIQGWLTLYALRLVLLPFILVYDLSIFLTEDIASMPDAIKQYMAFVGAVELGLLVTAVTMLYYFAKKKRQARDIKYLEATMCVYQIIAGVWLYSITQNYDTSLGSEGIKLFIYSFVALLWTWYWLYSKRVKATFVN